MQPLAERMRPKNLDDFIGQSHLVGQGAVLRTAIESGRIPSFILWGPPGVGKTTLASIIANRLDRPFFQLSAINAGVKDIRDTIEQAQKNHFFGRPNPILFIDEIHRFNKSQQDALLGAVEKGVVTLIGATTENPSFEVNAALLSRAQVYVMKALEMTDLVDMLHAAIEKDDILQKKPLVLEETDAILRFSGGDGRKLYNILELVAFQQQGTHSLHITNELVVKLIQENRALYDKSGEQHYDIASALIKSIRGSDPQAAVYWLARMLDGGEDVKFIGRRLIIAAAEDIGLANPNALLMAQTVFQSAQAVGMPEARIVLSQGVIYLAQSPKSNAAYKAINQAMAEVQKTGHLSVPLHLRNAPTGLMKDLGYGTAYKYAHDFPRHFVQQAYLPEAIQGKMFYVPAANALEQKSKEQLQQMWQGMYDYK